MKLAHVEEPGRNNDNYVTHPMECKAEDSWWANEDSEVTVTAGSSSVTGDAGLAPGEQDAGVGEWRITFNVVFTTYPASSTSITIDNIALQGVEINCSQLDQASDRTWITSPLRGWLKNDGGDYTAEQGPGVDSILLSYSGATAGNSWGGYISQPRAVSFANLHVHVFDPAGTELDPMIETQCFDIDGNRLVTSASALRAMGPIVDPRVYSWIARNSNEAANGYVWWTGYYPAAVQSIRMEDDWLKANEEYRCLKSGEEGYVTHDDSYIELWGWGYQAESRSEDPTFNGVFTLTHVPSINVNDPPTTSVRTSSYRPSDWVGSGGVTVDAGNNDKWTVAEGATSPQVTRDLVSIWFDRNNWVTSEGASPEYENGALPDAFLYNKANMDPNYPEPADNYTREDITNWDNYSFLRVGFDVPQAATLNMLIEWEEVTCYDNKDVDTRAEDYYYETSSRSYNYPLAFVSTGTGQYIDVDLINGPSQAAGVKMQHVTSITFSGFPENTIWELETLQLREQDSIKHFNKTKAIIPWKYKGTFFSGVVDGKITLAIPDDYGDNIEDTLEYLNWRFSSIAGDLTTAFTLEQIRNILNGQEGYTASFSSSGYEANYQDEEDPQGTLCTALPWHLQPEAHRDEDDDGWNYPMSIIVGKYTIAPGILYAFWNTDASSAAKLLEGGAHGVAFDGPDRADAVTIYMWKRLAGASSWGSYFDTASLYDLGYWTYEECRVVGEQGDNPPYDDVLYEYGISTTDDSSLVISIGSCENREWMLATATKLAISECQKEALLWDKTHGTFHVAYNGSSMLKYKEWTVDYTTTVDNTIDSSVDSCCPALGLRPNGDIICIYHKGDNIVYRTKQRDVDSDWSDMSTLIYDKDCPDAKYYSGTGKWYVSCLDGSNIYFYESDPSTDPDSISFGTVSPVIITTDADEERNPALEFDTMARFTVVYVDTGGNLAYKASYDGRLWS